MKAWRGRSVRARLTLLAGLLMCALSITVACLGLVGLRGLAHQYLTEQIGEAALRVVNEVDRSQITPLIADQGILGIQVVNPDGVVSSSSASVRGMPPVADFQPPGDAARSHQVVCDSVAYSGTCLLVAAFRVPEPDGDWTIYAFDGAVPWWVSARVLAMIVALPLLLIALTTGGTFWVVGRALAPVDAISRELATITATDLGHRVPVPPYRDEIGRMAETANQTLDRLEEVVERQRRFASDASHDLRSPLTAMRAEIEDALTDPAAADWPGTAQAVLRSLDQLQALISDVLQLARLDSGAPMPTSKVDLSALVTAELDRRPRKVEVVRAIEPGVVVRGDPLRLARLLTNLVDNAERHCFSLVRVSVARTEKEAVLEVLDDGAGVSPDKREVIFQRFIRLDASRRRDAGGTGLGLAIARQIAESHGGTLRIEDSIRGARFVLRIPI